VFIENSLARASNNHEPNAGETAIASFIDLSMVSCAAAKGIGFMKSPKIKMSTYAYGDVSISFETSSRDRDEMLSSLSRCLGELKL